MPTRPAWPYAITLDLIEQHARALDRLGFEVRATPAHGFLVDATPAPRFILWWSGDALTDWAALEAVGWFVAEDAGSEEAGPEA